MNKRKGITKNIKVVWIVFCLAFIITLISYWVLTFIYHNEVYYLGIVSLGLLSLFLLSIAYFMVVRAKSAIDEEVERKEEELNRQSPETNSEKK